MSHLVRVHGQAKQDIARNAIWWADHHSLDQALEWVDAIDHQLAELADCPQRHAFASENGVFPYEIRQKRVGLGNRSSYRAIFTIRDDIVHVLTIQRSSQDQLGSGDLPATL